MSDFKNLEGELKEFYDFHGVQLLAWGFPMNIKLLEQMFKKLKEKTFDAGEYFQILENEEIEQFQVKALKPQKKEENLFLIDHAVSFRYEQLREALEKDEVLLSRLAIMTKYLQNKIKIPGLTPEPKSFPEVEEYDFQDIEDPNSKKVSLNCQALSFYGNNISDIELLKQQLQKLPDLKVLWVNDNPVAELENFVETIESEFPNIEILNSKFTKNVGAYGFKFVSFGMSHLDKVQKTEENSVKFLDLSDRDLLNLENPEKVFENFENVEELSLKEQQLESLEHSNRLFAILKTLKKLKNINVDPEIEQILQDLYNQKKLQDITSSLEYVNGHDLKINQPPHPNEETIRQVMSSVWKLVGCYRLANSNQYDESAIWYINDELGSAIQHQDKGNVKIVPFLYAPNNKMDDNTISYSVCWTLEDIKEGQDITRDYLFGMDEKQQRSCKLYTWFDLPLTFFQDAYKKHCQAIENTTNTTGKSLIENFKSEVTKKEIVTKKLKVVTDAEFLTEVLTDSQFEFTRELTEADIIWFTAPIHSTYDKVQDHQMINQFPYESCICMKHNLSDTIKKNLGKVDWVQTTYDLNTELAHFIGDYNQRKENHQNNIWIIKPPNMARSLDMVVTDNIDIIIRQLESGPKLAQKYIERPLTIKQRKLDFRYIITLKSLQPLEVFVYNVFWVRTGNNVFTNDYRTREVYETHFTVMNYGKDLTQIHDHEFLKMFEEEYGDQIKWTEIEKKIHQSIKELFIGTQKGYPQMQDDRCRATYGLDVMIDLNDFQPKMLEITFSPDCIRACKFHPSFQNDVFGLLFLNKSEDETNHVRIV